MTIRDTIAKALCCGSQCLEGTPDKCLALLSCKNNDGWADDADRAIAALRASTPDDAMVERMAKAAIQFVEEECHTDCGCDLKGSFRCTKRQVRAVWAAIWETGE